MTTSVSRPRPRPTTFFLLALGLGGAVAVGGCGGGSGKASYPDAVVFGDGSVTSTGGVGVPGTGGGTITDAGAGTGGAPANPDAPVGAGDTRLFAGTAALLGPGISCSLPPTPTAGAALPDTWCGLFMPDATKTMIVLAVFDLTKAMAGAAIQCTAADPNCLILNTNISTAADATHGFNGQTLIYYDAQSVYAWRPGWTAGRVILSHDQMAHCEGAPNDATTALCINATTDTTVFNLSAGSIATQAGNPLPMVDTLANNSSGASFSLDGLSVLWSTSTSATAPETLKMQTIGDDTTRKTVASNVTAWLPTPDGQRWLWLSAPVTDATTMLTTGTLQTAPYPAGTAPKMVHTQVLNFAPYSATGVVVFATPGANGADLKTITDVDSPTTTTTVLEAADVFGFNDLNTSGTVLYYTDATQPDPTNNPNTFLINLFTAKVDGTGKCTVTTTATADTSARLDLAGSGVAWIRVTTGTLGATSVAGVLTTLADCNAKVFSSTVAGYIDVKAGLLVFENYNSTSLTADLSFDPFSAAGTLGTPARIQLSADTTVMPLFPSIPKVVFSINVNGTNDGIYVSPPLGAATTVVASALSGAAATTASSAADTPWAGARLSRIVPASTRPATAARVSAPTAVFGALDRRPTSRTWWPAALSPLSARAASPASSLAWVPAARTLGATPALAPARARGVQRSASRR